MHQLHTPVPLGRYIKIISANVTLILCVFGVHWAARWFFGIDIAAEIHGGYTYSFVFAYTSLLFIYDHLMRRPVLVVIVLTGITVVAGLSAGLSAKLWLG